MNATLKTLSIAVALALATLGSAHAQTVSVQQDGTNHYASVDQTSSSTGSTSTVRVEQSGNANRVGTPAMGFIPGITGIIQSVEDSSATVIQEGVENSARVSQTDGIRFGAGIKQSGTANEAAIAQSGTSGAKAAVQQGGSANVCMGSSCTSHSGDAIGSISNVDQRATDAIASIYQFGSDHSASVTQTLGSGGEATVVQDGVSHSATVVQSMDGGSPIITTVRQVGTGHSASAEQYGIRVTATLEQTGFLNETTILQSSNAMSANMVILQNGTNPVSGNRASVTQAVYGASATLRQNGSGLSTVITQTQ